MKAEFTSLVRAGRVLECYRAAALTDIAAIGKPCSLFITPLIGVALEDVDTVEVACLLQYNSAATVAPVVLSDWSPIIVNGVSAITSLDGNTTYVLDTDYALYYAPIAINER